MPLRPITDPALLDELNALGGTDDSTIQSRDNAMSRGLKPVDDPDTLDMLNYPSSEPLPMEGPKRVSRPPSYTPEADLFVKERKTVNGRSYVLHEKGNVYDEETFQIVTDPVILGEFGKTQPNKAGRAVVAANEQATPIQEYTQEFSKSTAKGAVEFIGSSISGLANLAIDDPARAARVMEKTPTIKRMSDAEFKAFLYEIDGAFNIGAAIQLSNAALEVRSGKAKRIEDSPHFKSAIANVNPQRREDTAFDKLGKKISGSVSGPEFQPRKGWEDSITVQLGQGTGSAVAMIPLSALGGIGPAAIAGSLAMSDQQADRAEQLINTSTRDDRAGLFNAGLGTEAQSTVRDQGLAGLAPGVTEAIPIELFLSRTIPGLKVFSGPIRQRFFKAVQRIATQALAEGGQEGVQQYLSNLIAQAVDPSVKLDENVLQSIALGAGVGGIIETPASLSEVVRGEPKGEDAPPAGGDNPAAPARPPTGGIAGAPAAPQSPAAQVPPATDPDAAILREQGFSEEEIATLSPEDRVQAVADLREAGVIEEPTAESAVDPSEPPPPTNAPVPETVAPENLVEETQQNGDGSRQKPTKVSTEDDIAAVRERVTVDPSDAQKKAGNYRKAHVRLEGLPGYGFTMETPKGGVRKGKDHTGQDYESPPQPADYGYFKRTIGADGQHVDGYYAGNGDTVLVIDQVNPDTQEFDEHKVIFGVEGADATYQGLKIYATAFSDGRGVDRIGNVTSMTKPEFKAWLDAKQTKTPVSETAVIQPREPTPAALTEAFGRYLATGRSLKPHKVAKTLGVPVKMANQLITDAVGKGALRNRRDGKGVMRVGTQSTPLTAIQFLAANGGIKLTGEIKAMDMGRKFVPGYGPLVRTSGMSIDEAREALVEAGYIQDQGRVTGGESTTTQQDVYDILSKERAYSQADEQAVQQMDGKRIEQENADRYPHAKEWGVPLAQMFEETGLGPEMFNRDDLELTRDYLEQHPTEDPVATLERISIRFESGQLDALPPPEKTEVHPFGTLTAEEALNAEPDQVQPTRENVPESAPDSEEPARQDDLRDEREEVHGTGEAGPSEATPDRQTDDDAGPDGKAQTVIPGTEHDHKGSLKRKAEARLKPKEPQKPADDGLFGDGHKQTSLLDQKLPPLPEGKTELKPEAGQDLLGAARKDEGKLDDFGEKLHGARKFMVSDYRRTLTDEVDYESEPLSKIFPVPDYEALAEQGVPAKTMALVALLRAKIPSKPRVSYRVARWAEQVKMIRGLADQLLNSDVDMDFVTREMKKTRLLSDVVDTAELIHTVPPESLPFAAKWSVDSGSYSVFNGVRYDKPQVKYFLRDHNGRQVGDAYANSLEELLEKGRGALDTALQMENARGGGRQTKISLFRDTVTKDYFIAFRGHSGWVRLKSGFTSVSDARSYRDENAAELQKQIDIMREGFGPTLRRRSNEPRKGASHRLTDATPAMFEEAFGFRGVQFGNYVEDQRRQKDLNDAYDSLMDLANVLKIPSRALSLNGKLGLAFGARGHGGKGAAMAHYEPTQVVINLTKMSGAGSLAHEWFHAMDNYFAKQDLGREGPTDVYLSAHHRRDTSPANTRDKVYAAFKTLENSIEGGGFTARAKKADEAKSKPYWNTTLEKAARSFERYVYDRLQEQGTTNDYLVNINLDGGAYPTADEMKTHGIRQAYDDLFGAMEVREGTKGPELYALDEDAEPAPVFFSALTRAVEGMKANKATATQWMGMIRNSPGVKPDEIKWLGLEDFLRQDRPVTKDALLDFLRANELKVEEKAQGGESGLSVSVATVPNYGLGEETQKREAVAKYKSHTFKFEVRRQERRGALVGDRPAVTYILFQSDGNAVTSWHYRPDNPQIESAVRQWLNAQLGLDSERDETQYSEYTLPGGEGYTELLIKLPRTKSEDDIGPSAEVSAKYLDQWDVLVEELAAAQERRENRRTTLADARNRPGFDQRDLEQLEREFISATSAVYSAEERQDELHRKMVAETLDALPPHGKIAPYHSPHWRHDNIVAHVRFTTRYTSADGTSRTPPKKTLHIEEVQSDWHEAGRKHGYTDHARIQEISDQIDVLRQEYGKIDAEGYELARNDPTNGEKREALDRRQDELTAQMNMLHDEQRELINESNRSVPDAPFKTTWPELAMKRAIRWAAENGYDRVVWTPGEQQAKRYDLARYVSSVTWNEEQSLLDAMIKDRGTIKRLTNVTRKNLADHIGWEAASKILVAPESMAGWRTVSEQELQNPVQIGGQGMRGFYDKIMPELVTKLIKKFGGKVDVSPLLTEPYMQSLEDFGVASGYERDEVNRPALIESYVRAKERYAIKTMGFDITDAMRESVMKGQPLFAKTKLPVQPRTPEEVAKVNRRIQDEAKRVLGRGFTFVPVRKSDLPQGVGAYFNPANLFLRVATDLASIESVKLAHHEFIHALRTVGAFTKGEWGHLARMAEQEWLAKYRIFERYEKLYRAEFPQLSDVELYDLLVEEAVAHAYADYANGARLPNSIFDAIFEKLTRLIQAMRGLRTEGIIFGDVYQGRKAKVRGKDARWADLTQAAPQLNALDDTPAFQKWFAGSKVVDDKGEPLIVYHGSPFKFDAFNETQDGMFFTDARKSAKAYGKNVVQAYLSIRNPFVANEATLTALAKARPDEIAERATQAGSRLSLTEAFEDSEVWARDLVFSEARRQGHDGIIIENDTLPVDHLEGDWGSARSFVAFSPTQIKSVNNRGTFDPDNPNILYALEDEGTAPAPKPEKKIDATNLNVDYLDTPEAIKEMLVKLSEQNEHFAVERRGVQSNAETSALAKEMGMTPEQLLKRKRGEAFNAEHIYAARVMLMKSAEDLRAKAGMATRTKRLHDLAQFQKALTRHLAIQEQVAGMTAEAGRALQQFKMMAGAKYLPGIRQTVDAQRRKKGPLKFDLEGEDAVLDLAKTINGMKDAQQIGAFTKDLKKVTFFDMIREAWISFLLSGPRTQAVNIVSNQLMALWNLPETALAATIGKLHGGEKVYFNEVSARAIGMISGARAGLAAAKHTFLTEEPSDAASKLEQANRKAIPGKLGRVIRVGPTVLMAADEYFKSVARQMQINADATRIALNEGLTGQALDDRIAQLKANPTPTMQRRANDFAKVQTFQNELGDIGKSAMKIRDKVPMGYVVVPFIRTVTNLFKQAMSRTPLGFVMPTVRADLSGANGNEARDMRMASMIIGTGICLVVASKVMQGLLSGPGPDDPDERKLLMETGWRPYSIKIGDKWYSYQRFDPFSTIISATAGFVELAQKMREGELEKIPTMLISGVSNTLLDKTWFTGPSEFLDFLDKPTERYLQRLAGTLVPTGVAQYTQVKDPYLRDVNSILDQIKSRIPGKSDDLPMRLNVFGEPIKREGALGPDILSPVFESTVKDDATVKQLLEVGYFPGMPRDEINKHKLSREQYWEYVKMSGQRAKRILDARTRSPGFARLSIDAREKFMRNTFQDARDLARRKMMMKYPELRKKR